MNIFSQKIASVLIISRRREEYNSLSMEYQKLKYVSICCILFALLMGTNAVKYTMRGKLNKVLRGPPVPPNVRYPAEEWFTQKLDHYNQGDSRVWQQRYYTNSTFHRPGGPAFLMIGGEGPIGLGWMLSGQWIELAQIHGAICFQLEHRFYGKSHPTQDLSLDNLSYLTSEQGLADLAYFIQSMNQQWNLGGSKWIVFGGSYPGSLAAWMRLKYPQLVHGAVSSSGPILAKADFKEYMEVVSDSLAYYSPSCVQQIRSATSQITSMIESGQDVSQLFRLCYQLNPNNGNDVANFYELMANNFAFIVQYNQWDSSGMNIKSACDVLNKNDGRQPIDRYAELNSMIMDSLGENCLNFDYQATIDYIRNPNWGDESTMYRQWFYQTCNEFGFYQTSNSSAQPFGSGFPLSFFAQQCTDVFGPNFNINSIKSSIDKTNAFYGGLQIDASRVVFVHGSIDPWHALGLTHTVSQDAPAIYIEGTSHCADMMPTSYTDSAQLKAAHEQIRSIVSQWLQ